LNVNIRHERKIRGWTLKQVADNVGVTVAAVNDMEKGRCRPSLEVYYRLISLFGYEVPRLVFGEADGASDLEDSIPQKKAGGKT
jgi:transcriptional regulator with XRE-family HTH domain